MADITPLKTRLTEGVTVWACDPVEWAKACGFPNLTAFQEAMLRTLEKYGRIPEGPIRKIHGPT